MNGPVRILFCTALAVFPAKTADAQTTSRPAEPPSVSAESQGWYMSGEPITYAGNLYYPAGPRVFFNGNEMVPSGSYLGVPLYTRTTIEPYSLVFVPLSGGLLQPYERRRTGDLAGTVGSSAPSFPVSVASEATPAPGIGATVQAPYSPTTFAPVLGPNGVAAPVPADTSGVAVPASAAKPTSQRPVGASGRILTPRANRPISPARRAHTANGTFVEFNNERWFINGPPAARASGMKRVGEIRGFPIYAEGTKPSTIYVPMTQGKTDVVVPYSKR